MSMNINELQTLNDHLNAMQKAMETLAGIEERVRKLEEMHEARVEMMNSANPELAISMDGRSEWAKARDEVWKLYPQAFSQPTPRGHAVYTQLTHLGGHKIADGKDREDAWIKAAGVVPAQVESVKPQSIDYESLAATNGDSIQQSTESGFATARQEVLARWPEAVCEPSLLHSGFVIRKSPGESPGGAWGETEREAWINQMNEMKGWCIADVQLPKYAPQSAHPRETRTEWEIARDTVLVKYPNAECHQIIGGYDISTAIMEGKNRVRTCFHGEGPTRADAWIRAAKNIERDGDDKVLPIEPVQSTPLEPWQIAKAEVLARYPNASCEESCELGCPAIYQKWTRLTSERIAHADTEPEAWIKAAKFINPPVAAAQSSQSIWSREIPSESGWYWWKICSDSEPDIVMLESENKMLYRRREWFPTERFEIAEFGPKIPDAETLAEAVLFVNTIAQINDPEDIDTVVIDRAQSLDAKINR